MSHLSDIGWYGLSKRLFGSTLFVPVALASAMLPTLSRLYREDKVLFNNVVRRFVGYMFLLVVPFSAVLMFAPRPLLAIMHAGPSFDGAIPVLIILGFSIILWFVSQAAATALIAQDGQDVLSRATGVAAAMAVPVCAGCIWLAQRTLSNGAIGAIVSDTIIELYLVTAYMRALPKGCVTVREFAVLGKAVIAAIPMVAPLYLIHGEHHIIIVAPLVMLPGLILFLPICYLLGCIRREDVDLVKVALGRKYSNSAEMELAVERGATVITDTDLSSIVSMAAQEQVAATAEGHDEATSHGDSDPANPAGENLGNAA
jgi:O-antigen/teichoic acid export membrane protein